MRPIVIIRRDQIIEILGIEGCVVIDYDLMDEWECPKCFSHLTMTEDEGDLYCSKCKINWEKVTPEILKEAFG